MVFCFLSLFSIDVDIIENHMHPLNLIVDRNLEFIFLHCRLFVFTNKDSLEERSCSDPNIKRYFL